ncbi:hypothetical protein [Streptomyces sp. TRM75561]|uniref:hypothetical protein n=1 Tax=Streptomyces sp. TRM75561 TaxID=2975269 RepID=UPI00244B3699|nr:hypothetical protein [Streptomyces sp. TRM75561]MDH3037160.1 hypothetical protein [Streptomyces sp. TRM75561]
MVRDRTRTTRTRHSAAEELHAAATVGTSLYTARRVLRTPAAVRAVGASAGPSDRGTE